MHEKENTAYPPNKEVRGRKQEKQKEHNRKQALSSVPYASREMENKKIFEEPVPSLMKPPLLGILSMPYGLRTCKGYPEPAP
ncbi:hypothetical protein Taro_033573 [Colocasia esculenta]|uniref:Uncharacterized protein n=1 Tax=Colocasia esculenta TaxID=4460 RepID=A0A843W7C8_COLES|nr:hypothetical protein [Colocasia esculenta]